MPLAYNYDQAKAYCQQIGLVWFCDDYQGLINADADAKAFNFTQEQVDVAMRNHLWQVRQLFEPKNYKFLHRLAMAFYFLSGWKLK